MAQRKANSASLVTALNHWMRREILRAADQPGLMISARLLEQAMLIPISNGSYHLRALWKGGVLEEMAKLPVRGSFEVLFRNAVPDNTIVRLVLEETKDEDAKAFKKWRRKKERQLAKKPGAGKKRSSKGKQP